MSVGDIVVFREGSFGVPGSRRHAVQSGAAATIKAGELVLKTPASPYVVVWTASNTAKPVVNTNGADSVAGLSTSTSTDTAGADGTVDIMPIVPGMVFLGNPTVPATFGTATTGVTTQATYDALVGDCYLLKTTAAGLQTIESTHNAANGIVIEPLDIAKYPGKVAFSLKLGTSYLFQYS